MNDFASLAFFHDLLDSVKEPVLFADTDHVVRYLNKAAVEFYPNGNNLLGCDLLECHNENSRKQLRDILQQMAEGLEEILISDNEKRRLYMRAVRNGAGELIGYFERFEPPRGS
ncbi:PAS fold-containing protein [Malonomonas rubra DSM 5091]|uniref:PAS fold-containing protein n=1 Tax=Malonomonas rubra DSM 5091 TaxID=1122189 RepID=A0A1M6I8Q4_MALRU|nr:PAS domain-containing protein [Malonomonas rubra]SHJ30812.1 PAS fold-containing protein [Malonomonas rubra DSM 5091]